MNFAYGGCEYDEDGIVKTGISSLFVKSKFINGLAVTALASGMMLLSGGHVTAEEVPTALPGCDGAGGLGGNVVGADCVIDSHVVVSDSGYNILENLRITEDGSLEASGDLFLEVDGDVIMEASVATTTAASINITDGSLTIWSGGNMTMGADVDSITGINADNGKITIETSGSLLMQGTGPDASGQYTGAVIESKYHDVTLNVMAGMLMEPGSQILVESRRTPVGVTNFLPARDTFLRPGSKNKNEGINPYLILLESGVDRDIIMGFDLGFTSQQKSQVTEAKIVLNIDPSGTMENWGAEGRTVSIHHLFDSSWIEGNGKKIGLPSSEYVGGSGPGVTWLCPTDTDLSNNKTDCDTTWGGGVYDEVASDAILHTNGMIGEVEWDVTEDVKNGIDNWLIRRTQGGGFVRYYSKDHPFVTDPDDSNYNTNLAPTLVVKGLSGTGGGVEGNVNINAAQGATIISGPPPIAIPSGSTDPYECPFFAISASPSINATNSIGGNINVLGQGTDMSQVVSIFASGCAIEAGRSETYDSLGNVIGGTGNEGGYINLQATRFNALTGAPIFRAVGDYIPDDVSDLDVGIGKGGAIRASSDDFGVGWVQGFGDVRPVGLNDQSVDGIVCVFTTVDSTAFVFTTMPTSDDPVSPTINPDPMAIPTHPCVLLETVMPTP